MSTLTTFLPGLFLLLLTALAWPRFLENIGSLDWRIGDMRPAAYGLQAILGGLAITSLLARNRVASLYHKIFPTRKKLLFAAIAATLSILLSLVILEAVCRLIGFPFDSRKPWIPSENALARFDPDLGWSYVPNRSAVQTFGTERRRVPVYFDDIGSRVRAPGTRHDPSKPTVLFVGDSYTMGHGLPYEETFPGRLESMPEFPFQVVNLGVEGHGTDQALLLLKRYFKKFNTQAVVYTYIDEHIARNVNYDRRTMYRNIRILGTKPLFALRPDGTLYLKKRPVRFEQLRYSRLLAYVRTVWTRWGQKPDIELTRALVREMKHYVESNGARIVVVLWYQRDYRKWNPPSTLEPGQFPFRGMDLEEIDTTINAPPDWNQWLIRGDEHPDGRANARVAQLIVDQFSRGLGTNKPPAAVVHEVGHR